MDGTSFVCGGKRLHFKVQKCTECKTVMRTADIARYRLFFEFVVAPLEPLGFVGKLGPGPPHLETLAVFFGSKTAWMLGSTPP